MIIVGDIASPNSLCSRDLQNAFNQYAGIFSGHAVVCNLEGLICDDISPQTSTPVLYNHSSVLPVLKEVNVKLQNDPNNAELYNKRARIYISYKLFALPSDLARWT